MTQLAALLVLSLAQAAPEQTLLDSLRTALDSGQTAKVQPLFARDSDAALLADMAGRSGVRSVHVNVIPAPPGWGDARTYWVVFHKRQGIESAHDLVFLTASSPDGMLVGREVPETNTGGWAISHARQDVVLSPAAHSLSVDSALDLKRTASGKAPVFRLGDSFRLSAASADGKPRLISVADDRSIVRPKTGDVVQAGGIFAVWSTEGLSRLSLGYIGSISDEGGGDRLTSKVCYLTAWWVPTIARQPYTTATRIRGVPTDWVVVSEGIEADPAGLGFPPDDGAAGPAKTFRCDIAISFPKVVGGQYKLAEEGKDEKGRVFRSYQLDPIEPDRAHKDVELMKRAVAFYEDTLGPWPFPGYSCFDADTYYGIESYSYTLLLRQNTTRFVAHEMGHTYFGGLVPNSYTRDCWNESLTQYVESILFSKNADKSLEKGLATLNVATPMSKMDRPGLFGSATYYRGAYVMTMLQNEIGLEKVIAGMKSLVSDRKGVDTTWPELRPTFEKAAGFPLDWFWDQWVEGATFPTLTVSEARLVQNDKGWTTWVTVKQTDTKSPFRLRFALKAGTLTSSKVQQAVLTDARATYRVDTEFKPTSISIDVMGLSLAAVGPPVEPKM